MEINVYLFLAFMLALLIIVILISKLRNVGEQLTVVKDALEDIKCGNLNRRILAKESGMTKQICYYVVEESTVPENLKAVDPFLVNVHEDSREPMQWRIFDDRPFEFLLKIVKKDAQTGNVVLKAGASYKIYDCEKETYWRFADCLP